MKNYFVSEKIDGHDKVVIRFESITMYKRIYNWNSSAYAISEINVGTNLILIYDIGWTSSTKNGTEEAERFDKEYCQWLESECN
jgi:hypothetical protein